MNNSRWQRLVKRFYSRVRLSVLIVLSFVPASSVISATITSWQLPVEKRFVIDAFDGADGSIYTLTNEDTAIRRYDPVTGALTATIDVGREFYTGRIVGDTMYALGEIGFDAAISIIDLPTQTILSTYDIPGRRDLNARGASRYAQIEPSRDGTRLFAKIGSEKGLVEIDPLARAVVGTKEVFTTNASLAFSPDGKTLYAVDASNPGDFSYLYVYELASGTLLNSTQYMVRSMAGQGRQQIVVHPISGAVYVGYVRETGPNADYQITEFDAAGEIARVINAQNDYGLGLGMTRDGSLLIGGNGEIYSTRTDALVADLPHGIGTYKVTMSATGRRAYVVNYNSFFVTVIDGLPVPEPATGLLVFVGLSAALVMRIRRGRRAPL
jgi:DNA-binding beta-propeller fold protein YncE